LVADSDVWTCREVADAKASKTDIGRFAESERLPQTIILDSQGKPSANVVPGKLATLMIW
jgi:hypothetical protein